MKTKKLTATDNNQPDTKIGSAKMVCPHCKCEIDVAFIMELTKQFMIMDNAKK